MCGWACDGLESVWTHKRMQYVECGVRRWCMRRYVAEAAYADVCGVHVERVGRCEPRPNELCAEVAWTEVPGLTVVARSGMIS